MNPTNQAIDALVTKLTNSQPRHFATYRKGQVLWRNGNVTQWQGTVCTSINHQNNGKIGPKLINRYGANIFP